MDVYATVVGPSSLNAILRNAVPGKLRLRLSFEGMEVPAVVVIGARIGPLVWVQAGLHGDEYDGMAACLRLADDFSCIETGTVVLVPIVNQAAFYAGQNTSPSDLVNMNRIFKNEGGDWRGGSKRFVAWYANMISACADTFLDLHGGGKYLDVCRFAMVPDDRSQELAQTTCLDFICRVPDNSGMLISELARRGLKAILHESGGGIGLREPDVLAHVDFVKTVLCRLRMLPETLGSDTGIGAVILIRSAVDMYFTEESGLLLWHLPCRSAVQRGDPIMRGVLAVDFSHWEMRCPLQNGYVLSIHNASLVKPGTYAAMIGTEF
jgi:predicted deacylase